MEPSDTGCTFSQTITSKDKIRVNSLKWLGLKMCILDNTQMTGRKLTGSCRGAKKNVENDVIMIRISKRIQTASKQMRATLFKRKSRMQPGKPEALGVTCGTSGHIQFAQMDQVRSKPLSIFAPLSLSLSLSLSR
jgi:hypothetical protein